MQKSATKEERAAALSKARNKLRDTRDALSNKDDQELYQAFMFRYSQMEIAYKSLLADYLLAHGKKYAEDDLKVEWRVVPRVLAYYSVKLNEEDRAEIFNGDKAVGRRHARGLRNSLAHAPNIKALEELAAKHSALNTSMDAFERALSTDDGTEC